MNQKIHLIVSTLALAAGAHASTIFEDFENYAPGDLGALGGWTVTNGAPLNPVDGPVAIVDGGFTWPGAPGIPSSGLQTATVGGVEPSFAGITEAYLNAAVPFVSLTSTPTSFRTQVAYTESIDDLSTPLVDESTYRNNFSIRLNADSGVSSNLLTILFTPSLTPDQYLVSWTSGFFASGSFPTPLDAGASTGFELNTYQDGLNVGYSFTNLGVPVQSGILAGASPTDEINRFSVVWDSGSGLGVGGNSITFDNVSVVPEPSSALLGLLGASFVFLRRRRA